MKLSNDSSGESVSVHDQIGEFSVKTTETILSILEQVRLEAPEEISCLKRSFSLEFFPINHIAARDLLVQQRVSEPGYEPPESQKRHRLLLAKAKDERFNPERWKFSKHEVAKAFNHLCMQAPLVEPRTAAALLLHVSLSSLEELWCRLYDVKLEKRMKRLFRSSSSSVFENPPITWLSNATTQNDLEYIRLLCQADLSQEVLNEALAITFTTHSQRAISILLEFGANPTTCLEAVHDHVDSGDITTIKHLLSASKFIDARDWRNCLVVSDDKYTSYTSSRPRTSTDILSLYLSHRPDIVCRELLESAVKSQYLEAMAIILAFASPTGECFGEVAKRVTELACLIVDNQHRLQCLTMFAIVGLLSDDSVTRKELRRSVQDRHLQMIQLLVSAGVTVNSGKKFDNPLYMAVGAMDLELLEILIDGELSESPSLSLDAIPDAAAEDQVILLIGVFSSSTFLGSSWIGN